MFEIKQQTGDGDVGSGTVLTMILGHIRMGIPTVGISRVKLDETYALLKHSPREQTTRAKLLRLRTIHSVKRAGVRGLFRKVDQFRGCRLHSESEFVSLHSSRELIITKSLLDMPLVQ